MCPNHWRTKSQGGFARTRVASVVSHHARHEQLHAAAVQVEKEVSTCDDQIAETKGDHFRCTAIGSAGKHTGKIPLVERAGARTIPKSRRIRNRYGDERPGHRCRI